MPRQTTDDESSSPPRQFTARRAQSKRKSQELSSIESTAAASWQSSVATSISSGNTSLPAIARASSQQGRRRHSKQSSEFLGNPVSRTENSMLSPARRRASSDEFCDKLLADPDQSYTSGALANDEGEDTLVDRASKADFFRDSGRHLSKESARAGGQARFNTAGTSRHPSKESAGARGRANPEGSLTNASKESVGANRARANTDASVLHPSQDPTGSRGYRRASKESVGAGRANTDASVLHPSQEPAGSRGRAASDTEGPCDAVSSFATQHSRRRSKESSSVSRQQETNSGIMAYESSNSSSLADRRFSKVSAKAPQLDDVKSEDQAATSRVSGVMSPVSSVLASPRKPRGRQASKEAVDVSDGVRRQAMSSIGGVPTHEPADILRDHRTKTPKSSPGLLPQVATEAAASLPTYDADAEASMTPSDHPRAAVMSARLLLSEKSLGGRSVDVPTSGTACERWGHVRRMTSNIRSMLAAEVDEVSVSDEVIQGQLDDSMPMPMHAETKENAYWNRLWNLGKLQRLHLADEHSLDSFALPEVPLSPIGPP